MRVDLPALGKPTSATSAINLSSRSSQCSSPRSPCSAKAGARRRLDRKRALPRPPRPPWPRAAASPATPRSARTDPVGRPDHGSHGHRHLDDRRRWPRRSVFPAPCAPLRGPAVGVVRESRAATPGPVDASSQTSPPVPPSPPSGPPLETWASRRKRHASRATVARFYVDLGLVNEARHRVDPRRGLRSTAGAGQQRRPVDAQASDRHDVDQLAALAGSEVHAPSAWRTACRPRRGRRSRRGGSACPAGER